MRKRILPLLALVALLLNAGCLIDGKLDDKGGATMKVAYRLAPNAKVEAARKQMESSIVKVTNAAADKENRATFDLEVKDVTKLNSATFFKNVQVKLSDGEDKGTKVFVAKHVNDRPGAIPEKLREYYGDEFQVSLTFPGEVVKSNATETKGDTATWKMTLNDFLKTKETDFQATYKVK
jgi:LppM domain